MRGLKIIPLFLGLMVLTYLGMLFVEANHEDVVISLGTYYQSLPIPLGFVVLTATLIGMCLCGILCSVELLALYMQNRNLKRRLHLFEARLQKEKAAAASAEKDKTARRELSDPLSSPTDIIRGH